MVHLSYLLNYFLSLVEDWPEFNPEPWLPFVVLDTVDVVEVLVAPLDEELEELEVEPA